MMLNTMTPTTVSIFLNSSIKRFFSCTCAEFLLEVFEIIETVHFKSKDKKPQTNKLQIIFHHTTSVYTLVYTFINYAPLNTHSVIGSVQFVRVSIQYNTAITINCIL